MPAGAGQPPDSHKLWARPRPTARGSDEPTPQPLYRFAVPSDGTEIPAEATVQAAFPQPALGPAVRVTAGGCATAWVVSAVPGNTRPSIITFQGYGGTAVWLTK